MSGMTQMSNEQRVATNRGSSIVALIKCTHSLPGVAGGPTPMFSLNPGVGAQNGPFCPFHPDQPHTLKTENFDI